VSPATVSRYLARQGLVVPEPKKRPRSSYIRFQADQPNECWQADFTHYPLADGTGTEILTWLAAVAFVTGLIASLAALYADQCWSRCTWWRRWLRSARSRWRSRR
jgi:transposase InsO family protein